MEVVVSEPRRLRRGEVVDIPDGPGRWEAYLTWPAGAELDVVAFLIDGAERVPPTSSSLRTSRSS